MVQGVNVLIDHAQATRRSHGSALDAAVKGFVQHETTEPDLPCEWYALLHHRHRNVVTFPISTVIPSSDATTDANTSCEEVVQQSRIRHKEDFVIAFSPVVAEAAAVAYKGAPAEIQAKLRRVIDVWKDRTIFEAPIQAAIEARLNGMRPSCFAWSFAWSQ